jgi:cobalt-zinc-cadmium efflux system outer membrane protein
MAAARADVAISTAGVQVARSQRGPILPSGQRRLSATNDTAGLFGIGAFAAVQRGRAAVAQAAAEQSRAEALQRLTEQDVAQAITSAQAEADNAATAARAASGPALEAAQEAARIARTAIARASSASFDLLDAERTLVQTA